MNPILELLRADYIAMSSQGFVPEDVEEVEERAAEAFDSVMAQYARHVAHHALNRLSENVFDSPGVPLIQVLADTRNEIDGVMP